MYPVSLCSTAGEHVQLQLKSILMPDPKHPCMATIYNWIMHGGNVWQTQEGSVLTCFRSLADKPALAATLLQEMRLQTSLDE